MPSQLTPSRAAIVLALCATLSALLSNLAPGWQWSVPTLVSDETVHGGSRRPCGGWRGCRESWRHQHLSKRADCGGSIQMAVFGCITEAKPSQPRSRVPQQPAGIAPSSGQACCSSARVIRKRRALLLNCHRAKSSFG
jgi:hypothetical protein